MGLYFIIEYFSIVNLHKICIIILYIYKYNIKDMYICSCKVIYKKMHI